MTDIRSNARPADPLEAAARALALAAGQDPEARIPHESKPGRTMPAWVAFRAEARAARHAAARQAIQPDRFRDAPLTVFGTHESAVLGQMRDCLGVGQAVRGVLCADGHLGYAQPVGGVIAYEGQISISGVGFDIGCGNLAARLDTPFPAIADRVPEILGEIRRVISFGIGRANAERVAHPLLDDEEAWAASGVPHPAFWTRGCTMRRA